MQPKTQQPKTAEKLPPAPVTADSQAPYPRASWTDVFRNGLGLYTITINLAMALHAIDVFIIATVMPKVVQDIGGTSPYTWTGTGLPAGVSVSSSGTVSGTPTTAGTYNATVTATAASGGSGSATFTFTISGGGGGGTCSGQKLGNPGFETGTASPWTASSGVVDNSAQEAAHSLRQPADDRNFKALRRLGTQFAEQLHEAVTAT